MAALTAPAALGPRRGRTRVPLDLRSIAFLADSRASTSRPKVEYSLRITS